jgi:hypothetical protein
VLLIERQPVPLSLSKKKINTDAMNLRIQETFRDNIPIVLVKRLIFLAVDSKKS